MISVLRGKIVEKALFFRLKKHDGRIYLTRFWYETGKRREKSIGPVNFIERIVDEWKRKYGRSRLQDG